MAYGFKDSSEEEDFPNFRISWKVEFVAESGSPAKVDHVYIIKHST